MIPMPRIGPSTKPAVTSRRAHLPRSAGDPSGEPLVLVDLRHGEGARSRGHARTRGVVRRLEATIQRELGEIQGLAKIVNRTIYPACCGVRRVPAGPRPASSNRAFPP